MKPEVIIEGDRLLPATDVQVRYSISHMTLWRWLHRSDLNFPQPIVINRRRYFRAGELVAWERRHAAARAA